MNAVLQHKPKEPSRADWLAARKSGIGGSDVAAVLGLSKWKTPLDVWLDKTGQTPANDGEDSQPMLFGRLLEPVILQHYCTLTGQELVPVEANLRHPEHSFMLANLDGLTKTGRVVEAKTARTKDGWGEAGSDEIPMYYTTQVQHAMLVAGKDVADVPVLIGGQDFRIYTVEADRDIQAMLVERERVFWQRVIDLDPPPPSNLADIAFLYKKSNGQAIEATEDAIEALGMIGFLNHEIKRLEGDLDTYKQRLFGFMGDNEALTVQGDTVATWKTQTRKTFDSKRFELAYPELFAQFRKESASRVLRLK